MDSTHSQQCALRLDAVAANAASLTMDIRNNKLWEGEAGQRLAIIHRDMQEAQRLIGSGSDHYQGAYQGR